MGKKTGVSEKPKLSEASLQIQCVSWFKWHYKNRIIWHNVNEGKRSYWGGKQLQKQGMTKGIPDLTIPEPFGAYSGLYIELKVKPNTVTEAQEEMLSLLANRNYMVRVCWTFEEFIATVREYFGQEERKAA